MDKSDIHKQLEQEVTARQAAEKLLKIKNNELNKINAKLKEANKKEIQLQQLNYELKTTKIKLSSVIANLQGGVLIEDKQSIITLVNKRFYELFDISLPSEALIGTDYTVVLEQTSVLFKDPATFVKRINEILQKNIPVLNEIVELADGRIYARDYAPIVIDGISYGTLWKYIDITERANVEKKLQLQKKFYEDVLNEIPADIVVFSTDHRYVFLNPVAIHDPELRKWMIGKTDEEYCRYRNKPMSIAENRNVIFDKVITTKTLHTWEEKLSAADGTTEHHLRNLYPVLNEKGEVTSLIGYGINITDRKGIEERLKLNEKRYRDLFNFSQALICTHDIKGTILSVNPAICQLLGFTREELIGQSLLEVIPSKDRKGFQINYLDKVTTYGKANGVFKILAKSGRLHYLLYQNYKVEEENVETYIIGFSQDITDRINAEKELRVAKQFTEDVANTKERFLANMSHEIRTPMNGILGITNLLAKTCLDGQQQNYLKLISDSANNLLIIVNDILDLEKIASGKFEFEDIPFRLVEKVSNVVQSFQYKAEEKDLKLTFVNHLAHNLIVIGDPYRLGQVLNNLLNNALKFTEHGGITISIDAEKEGGKKINVSFSVLDTGIGISQDNIKNIFDPFVQASSNITRKYGGTGLGLSICKNLIEMQGGTISVKSEIEEGTNFVFVIPYTIGDLEMLVESEREEIDYTSMGKKKILVAEDVAINQLLVKHILEPWGFDVFIVNNGEEAVNNVIRNDYDLVLMDIQMPEMDGLTATSIIRHLQGTKASIPIIALTANALKGDNQRYLDAGMDDYISKPFTEENLYKVISKFLNAKKYIDKDITVENNIPANNGTAPEKLYDLTLLNSIGKGDPDFVYQMVMLFLEIAPADLQELNVAGNSNNWNAVSQIAHKMKSASGGMGLDNLTEKLQRLEVMAKKQEEVMEIPAMIKDINDFTIKMTEQLTAEFVK